MYRPHPDSAGIVRARMHEKDMTSGAGSPARAPVDADRSLACRPEWLGKALIAWLWGVALYLAAYMVLVSLWSGDELYERVGQDFWNAHIPGGGWEAVVVPTADFLVVLALVAVARRPLAAVAGVLVRSARLPRRAAVLGSLAAMTALALPAAHAGVVAARDGIVGAIRSARVAADKEHIDALMRHEMSRNRFWTGEGMAAVVTGFSNETGLTRQRLLLDSAGNYRRTWSGCVPDGGTAIEGPYEQHGDDVVLEAPAAGVPPYFDSAFPIRLHDVRWSGRRYLLDDAEMRMFCQAVNDGSAARADAWAGFLLRDGDAKVEVEGLPAVPAPWNDLLLKAPIEGHLLSDLSEGGAWLDLGAEAGVRVGMQLFVADAPLKPEFTHWWGGKKSAPCTLEVLEVEAGRSRVGHPQNMQPPATLLPIPAGSMVSSLRPPSSPP
jgi:hypothetical protein